MMRTAFVDNLIFPFLEVPDNLQFGGSVNLCLNHPFLNAEKLTEFLDFQNAGFIRFQVGRFPR